MPDSFTAHTCNRKYREYSNTVDNVFSTHFFIVIESHALAWHFGRLSNLSNSNQYWSDQPQLFMNKFFCIMRLLLIVGFSSVLFASQKCCSAFAPIIYGKSCSTVSATTTRRIRSSSSSSSSSSRSLIPGDDMTLFKHSKKTSYECLSNNANDVKGTHDNNLLQPLGHIKTKAQKILFTVALSVALCCSTVMPSSAIDYGALTDEQRAVAEAWRIVDNNFIDRTFNHQDWFKVRQDAIKKKYKNMAEAQNEIDHIVSSLGDKYTRYLPPAKYRSIVDSATGTLAGVGVEISMDKDTGRIYVSDTEPSSPASMGE